MKPKLNRAQRKAAGHTCRALFHIVMTAGHTLKAVARPVAYDPGDHPLMGTIHWMGDGLTKKERAYVEGLADNLLNSSEQLRQLGSRFLA